MATKKCFSVAVLEQFDRIPACAGWLVEANLYVGEVGEVEKFVEEDWRCHGELLISQVRAEN